jgi:ABC-type sugar transport system substrate-binding protein
MKLRNKLSIAVSALALVGLLAGCSTATATGTTQGSAKDKLTIGVSFDLLNDIRNAELAAIKAAAKSHGDKVEFVSADQDAQKQASQIQDLIQSKSVDAVIVIAVNSDQIASSIALAKSKSVPFIAVDRTVADSGDVAFQVTGNAAEDGKLAAKEVLAASGDHKVIQLVGALTDQNAVGRRDGFTAGIKAGGSSVIAEVPTDWDPAKALDGTSNALQANPDINSIFIPSDYLLPSVISALKAAGRLAPVGDPKHVFIVTIDGDPNGCQAIKDKNMDSDVVTPIGQFGNQAVDAAHVAHSGKSPSPAKALVAGVVLNQANFSATSADVWGCTK